STANIELENIGTGPFGDMSEAFGTGSPEWNDAVASNAAPSGTALRAQAITGGNPCVNNTEGQPVTDPFGRCGFPGFDWALANNTLGYVAQMQESGVPVTYAYISDAHDNHTSSFPAPFNP